MKIRKGPEFIRGVWVTFFILLITSAASADSLWVKTAASPYTTQKAFKVGDLITVLVLETTSAAQKAGTNTGFKDDLSLGITNTISKISKIIPTGTSNLQGSFSNKYAGTGQTSRSSAVQAKISATVTEVLPNGTVRIKGTHKVKVNDETQEILVSGLVRAKDISLENTILSYQVAEADIEVKGSGTVGSSSQPGWLTRFLNWLF